jgi:hypothetical protein|tara:strand:+ start:7418 stop:7849 length:432 start_codon:yes stop_codon:yes gene_type:complete
MPISPGMLQRSRALKRSDRWTTYIRGQYPPAADSRVIVAWDSGTSRWVLAYDTEDVVIASGVPTRVRYLKSFYIWQGPGDSYLEPGPLMVRWLREHDLFSAENVNEWQDCMFGAQDKLKKERELSAWDDVGHDIQQMIKPRVY